MRRTSVASQGEIKTLYLFFSKLSFPWKLDAITACFRVCTFNLFKTKAQKIEVET